MFRKKKKKTASHQQQSAIAFWRYSSDVIKLINTLRLRQNGQNFAYDIFKRFFVLENSGILFTISLKFVRGSN